MLVVVQYEQGAVGTLHHAWDTASLLRGLRLSRIDGTHGSVTTPAGQEYLSSAPGGRLGRDGDRLLQRSTTTGGVTDLGTPWGESPSCTSCGKCVQVCPTGALFEKGRSVAEGAKHPRPFLPYLRLIRDEGPRS